MERPPCRAPVGGKLWPGQIAQRAAQPQEPPWRSRMAPLLPTVALAVGCNPRCRTGRTQRGESRSRDEKPQADGTGVLMLDLLLDGLPRGHMVEAFGPPQAGKTSLALAWAEGACRQGRQCFFMDLDRTLDHELAPAQMVVLEPKSAEEAVRMAEDIAKSSSSLIVIDSIANLVPEKELAGDMKLQYSDVSRLTSIFCRKMERFLPQSGATILFINHFRSQSSFDTVSGLTCGGNALAYRSSIRLCIQQLALLGAEEHPHGARCHVEVLKNKVSAHLGGADFDLVFGEGISWEGSVLDATRKLKLPGFDGEREELVADLLKAPEACDKLAEDCRESWALRCQSKTSPAKASSS